LQILDELFPFIQERYETSMFASFIDIKKNGEHVAGPKLAAGTAQET